jgi:hypothetical protein
MFNTNAAPVLNIHSKSTADDKEFYRSHYKFKVHKADTSKAPMKAWIIEECHRQEVWNLRRGVDIDFVMEEYYCCHPDVCQGQEKRGVEEKQKELVLEKLEEIRKKTREGSRIIVDWGFFKRNRDKMLGPATTD